MQSRPALCPAWERPPLGQFLAEEETPGAGSCAERRAGERHPLGAGGSGRRGGLRSPGCSGGHPERPMLGWLLAALAALARGGSATAPGFSCWKQCSPLGFRCSWPPHGPPGNTSYLLTLCYTSPRLCQEFEAGARTMYPLNHRRIYVLTNVTAWVEARWGGHVHRTPNITLYLDKALKPNPPPAAVPFTRSGGRLRLQVPRPPCHPRAQPLQREARFRRTGDHGWTQVTCEAVTDEDDTVTCALGGDGAFEVQLRHKPPHWSSYWSDWSGSIFVPKEILESPALSYQLGELGPAGQRVLQLGWQRAPEEQGNVTYTLRSHMPACSCTKEDTVELGTEVTAHNLTLSGAEYQILLTAANAAGTGPPRQLLVPAARRSGTCPAAWGLFSTQRDASQPLYPSFHPDLGFKNVSVVGSAVMVQWEAPSAGLASCFEQQLLQGAAKRGVCTQRGFPAKSIHVERGALDTPACHRLAVHGWSPARGWATFALHHHYAGNASPAVPIRINTSTSDATVVLQWSPSPRATCPGVLAKYLICHVAEGDNVTYAEADAAASHFTLQNLLPGTVHRVSVQEVTAESKGTCGTWWHFQTKALGPQGAAWKSNLKYLGILLCVPTVAAIYQLSKKRARRLLFPPLPEPVGSKAIEFTISETASQCHPRPGFVEPSEKFSLAELLLTEPNPGQEVNDAGTRSGTPQPSPTAAQEPVTVSPPELPFTYRRQDTLSPPGFEPHDSAEEEEEEEEGRQVVRQPLVPIALLISDKPVIIRDQAGWDPAPEELVL
ncbi:LOW QUALITY PROTEIN: interleukin-12 receptor subunit beta-1 [Patagioenas fasciata]|uniref:LOW QUALITY PROTEIN: interleukin-12 receptor subunit beta-1 n=1 Tax=Patagioenas fasciata TaxID=372321 RepID=UPI003A99CE0B